MFQSNLESKVAGARFEGEKSQSELALYNFQRS